MPLSKNLNTYTDVLQVLTTARKNGGAVYELRSPGAATNWVARAYYYRTLLTKTAIARAGQVKGFIPSTDWDDMLLTREGAKITIAFGRLAGKLTGEDGAELTLSDVRIDSGASEAIIQSLEPAAKTATDLDLDELERIAVRLKQEQGA